MSKNNTTPRVLTSPIHDDLSAFSESMVNGGFVNIKEVSNNKLVDGKVVKGTVTRTEAENKKDKYQTDKMPLLIKDASNPEAIITTNNSDAVYLSNQSISLSDEALLYLVHLAGHPKNVFLYILFYLLNEETLEFRTNGLIQNYYMEFCKTTRYKAPSSSTMKDAIKTLSEMHLIINVARNRYMMNPIVLGFNNNMSRNRAFTLYANKLAEKKLVVEDYLLPQIGLLKK